MLAPAPKSYACKYTDHEGGHPSEKIKFKGVPKACKIGGTTSLSFDAIAEAYYQSPGQKFVMLPSKPQVIKRPTKSEGAKDFEQVVNSDLRNGQPIIRTLFNTRW